MDIDIKDPRFLAIVDENLERETISEDFQFTEGPIWHPIDAHVTFSDIPANRMYRWSEVAGLSVYREPSNMANGNTYDLQGRMLSCEHATSRVVREQDGEPQVIASHFNDKELNSPNDIIVSNNGEIFFTDPLYGRQGNTGVVREPELDFQGVYKLDPESLELTLLGEDFQLSLIHI